MSHFLKILIIIGFYLSLFYGASSVVGDMLDKIEEVTSAPCCDSSLSKKITK